MLLNFPPVFAVFANQRRMGLLEPHPRLFAFPGSAHHAEVIKASVANTVGDPASAAERL